MTTDTLGKQIVGAKEIAACIEDMAQSVLEAHPVDSDSRPVCFVGIHTGGVVLAERVHAIVRQSRPDVALGSVDISLYRDDLDNLDIISTIQRTHLPFAVENARVILIDDVLCTGRTIRAAIDLLVDYGRPARIELAVLVDRGMRELPVSPDYTGMAITAEPGQKVKVLFGDQEGIYLQ